MSKSKKTTEQELREITRNFVRGAIESKILNESMEELPPPGANRKPVSSTDAIILADDYIQAAVFDGLEEMGMTAEQADVIINQLHSRPDMLKQALAAGLEDYKRKLGMTGRPKPRNEGTELDNMSDAWRQVLGNCLTNKGKK